MESANTKGLRAVLPLGKCRIVEKGEGFFKIALGGSTTMTITVNNISLFDIHDGDLLTLYTEVLLAKPSRPSIE
jgi:hypothetical protein